MSDSSGPSIGFFPLSYNLAEVGRSILVAQEVKSQGGRPVFFSHGGKYEYLIKEFGFDIIDIVPRYSDDSIQNIIQVNRKEKKGIPYHYDFLRQVVDNQIIAFQKNEIDLLVSFVNFPCTLSARIAQLFHVDVSPGPGRFHYSIPDTYETAFSRFIPQSIKVPLYNYLFYKSGRKIRKPFNLIANEYDVAGFDDMFDLIHGDYTLVTNFLEFINVFSDQQQFPNDAYVGIILLEELFNRIFPLNKEKQIDRLIKNHLETKKKKVLLTMGSSGDRQLFLNILNTLDKTEYQVIAVYANILDENSLPHYSDNILLIKFVPSLATVHNLVDLSIIHGGQGTVFTAAYAGKPVIGFPMQFEQHLQLEKMVGHGSARMLSKKFFDEKKLLSVLKNIFSEYGIYQRSAQKLASRLPPPQGEKIAAEKIYEISLNIQKK